ncbi:MAG: hypothetical protein CFE32_08800 [Alphaproteobacteria bacterium PA3]|nr:MAG: hypothetical protein CFE32_08800 [Alphaproteobacteria bacterium PA3]
MNDRVPPHDALNSEAETPSVNKVNHLSRKTYLRGTSRLWGLGIIGLASAASLGWIWRTDLAESGVQSLLRQRGIEGGISFTKLSVNQATIRDLRLGPASDPTLFLPTASLSWHVDVTSGRLVIDRLEAHGAKLHIGMTKAGEPDFGALKPFLIPSDKPSQVRLADVVLRDTLLSFDSPLGKGSARIEARGGDQQGWRAQMLVTPPQRISVQSSDRPLALGLALIAGQQDNAGQKSPTQIGIALQPDGQSYRWGDMQLDRIAGQAQAHIILDGKGGTRVETRAISLTAQKARLQTLTLQSPTVQGGIGQWQHQVSGSRPWSETGFGTLIGRFEAKSVQAPQGTLKNIGVDFSTARTQTGLTRLDVKGSGANLLSNPALGWRAGSADISGFAQAVLKDLRQAPSAVWEGQTQIAWTNLIAPSTSTPDPVSGKAGLAFVYGPKQAELRVSEPVDLALGSGPKLRFMPDGKRPPLVRFDLTNTAPAPLEAFGAGDIAIQAPNSGRGQGRLEDFSWNPSGWTLAARNFTLKNVPLPGSASAFLISGQLGDLSLAAKTGEVPVGAGRGTLEVAAKAGAAGLGLGAGRAKLTGQVRGDGQTLMVSLAGPIEGFGKNGPGARQGRLALDAKATRAKSIWTIDLDGQVGVEAFRSPDLNVLDLTGGLKGRARVGTLPSTTRSKLGVEELGLANLTNWDADLTFNGSVERVSAQGFGVRSGVLKAPITARGDGRSVEGNGQISLVAERLGFDDMHVDEVRADVPVQFSASPSRAQMWQANATMNASAASFTSGDSFVEGLRVNGPVQAGPADNGLGMLVRGDTCLALSAEQGRFPGDATVGPVKTSLCPDRLGRFASVTEDGLIIFADARFEPLELRLGALEDGRSLRLGAIRGDFKPAATGGWQLDLTSKEVGYTFKLPDGGFAELNAQDSTLRLTPDPSGMTLRGQLAGLRAKGLPVEISGTASADLAARRTGLVGSLAFENLLVRDVPTFFPALDENGQQVERPARFGMLSLTGDGTINGSQIDIQSDISLAASGAFLARAILNHNAETGLGRLDALAETISFGQMPKDSSGVLKEWNRPLDADDIVPALQGVILDVVGDVSGSASMAWGPNQATVSDAKLSTANLDFLTMLGQVTNLTGDFSLDDLLKVRSAGQQGFTVAQFDPGLPIEDVNVVFTLPGDNTLQLTDASWPFADGKLSVRPASWTFRDGDQSFAVDVEDVDLAKFLGLTKIPNLQIDGKVSGVFPIEARNGSVEIVGGRLQARDGGGKIRYTGPIPGSDPKKPPKKLPWYQRWFAPKQPTQAEIAAQALAGIEYEIDMITVDGRITGDLTLGVVLVGANPQVLSGVPIKVNVKATLPVGQITDMANAFFESATNADMLKELDKLDRSRNGKGIIPTEEEDKAAQALKSKP